MHFSLLSSKQDLSKLDALILPVWASNKLPGITKYINKLYSNKIIAKLKCTDFSGKSKESLLLISSTTKMPKKILLIGCGPENTYDAKAFKDAMATCISQLKTLGKAHVGCCLTALDIKERNLDLPWQFNQIAIIHQQHLYTNNHYRSIKAPEAAKITLGFYIDDKLRKSAQAALTRAEALHGGLDLTCDLANAPANVCTPDYLAKVANHLAANHKKLKVEVLSTAQMQKLHMGALLAVAQGSINKPRLITLSYKGSSKNDKPYVFVGKGITFDTGGNSLKSPTSMIDMKYDMCGAATVLGLIHFASQASLPINVVGVIAAAENMPGPYAIRPNDIITSMSGLTIEVLNTDAEGRLVLCDALTYCKKFKPQTVIDIATLTGACVVALGSHYSGMYSNCDELAQQLMQAGQDSGDKCWRMPLGEEYHKQLESSLADLANIGGPGAGSVTAACFLERFASDMTWAHLDIAGTAYKERSKTPGATGQPLGLLAHYLCARASTL